MDAKEKQILYRRVQEELQADDFTDDPPFNERITRFSLTLILSLLAFLGLAAHLRVTPQWSLDFLALTLLVIPVLYNVINEILSKVGFRYGYRVSLVDPFYRAAIRAAAKQREGE
jgi:hypothetical protein